MFVIVLPLWYKYLVICNDGRNNRKCCHSMNFNLSLYSVNKCVPMLSKGFCSWLSHLPIRNYISPLTQFCVEVITPSPLRISIHNKYTFSSLDIDFLQGLPNTATLTGSKLRLLCKKETDNIIIFSLAFISPWGSRAVFP